MVFHTIIKEFDGENLFIYPDKIFYHFGGFEKIDKDYVINQFKNRDPFYISLNRKWVKVFSIARGSDTRDSIYEFYNEKIKLNKENKNNYFSEYNLYNPVKMISLHGFNQDFMTSEFEYPATIEMDGSINKHVAINIKLQDFLEMKTSDLIHKSFSLISKRQIEQRIKEYIPYSLDSLTYDQKIKLIEKRINGIEIKTYNKFKKKAYATS